MEGSSSVLRKGAWSKCEDDLLKACVQLHGEGKWHLVPQRTGLNRCRKSCRLRWLNYLKPNIKRGEFIQDEIDLMMRMHKLLGNRWSLIAGRLPGRTPNDVKNYWNTYIRRRKEEFHKKENNVKNKEVEESTILKPHEVIKPVPRALSKTSLLSASKGKFINSSEVGVSDEANAASPSGCGTWWETLLDDYKEDSAGNNSTCLFGWEDIGAQDLWDENLTSNIDLDFLPQVETWINDFLLDQD